MEKEIEKAGYEIPSVKFDIDTETMFDNLSSDSDDRQSYMCACMNILTCVRMSQCI